MITQFRQIFKINPYLDFLTVVSFLSLPFPFGVLREVEVIISNDVSTETNPAVSGTFDDGEERFGWISLESGLAQLIVVFDDAGAVTAVTSPPVSTSPSTTFRTTSSRITRPFSMTSKDPAKISRIIYPFILKQLLIIQKILYWQLITRSFYVSVDWYLAVDPS